MTKETSAVTYWKRCKDEVLAGCDLCGTCLEVCPRYQFGASGLKDYQRDIERYHEFWRTGKVHEDLYDLVHTCTGCAFCRDVCPMGFNVYDCYNHYSKHLSWGAGLPPKSFIEPRMPHVRGNIASVLSAMQMKPEQVRWHWDLDSSTPKKEVLLFIGCITHSHPDKILTLLDVFDRMGVDYLPLGGGPICCGGTFLPIGEAEVATERAKDMVAKFNEYGASSVVFWCANCVRHCMGFIPQIADLRFEPVHASTFIARNLDRLNFTHPLDSKINVHVSCVLGRSGVRDYDSVRTIFEAIPGLKVVEHAESRQQTPCCAAGRGDMNLAPPIRAGGQHRRRPHGHRLQHLHDDHGTGRRRAALQYHQFHQGCGMGPWHRSQGKIDALPPTGGPGKGHRDESGVLLGKWLHRAGDPGQGRAAFHLKNSRPGRHFSTWVLNHRGPSRPTARQKNAVNPNIGLIPMASARTPLSTGPPNIPMA